MLALAGFMILAGACSSADPSVEGSIAQTDAGATPGDPSTLNDVAESPLGDASGIPEEGDGAPIGPGDDTQVSPDPQDVGAVDDDSAGSPLGKAFGETCDEGSDCESGWCVPGPDGTICASTCDSQCPEGWACQVVTGSGGDPISLCINITAQLCHPCEEDSDCNYGGQGANRCVDRGDDGSFCGLLCGAEGYACPDGYVCQEPTPGEEGESTLSPQCIPADDAVCTCNGLASILKVSTTCYQTNEWGSCAANRSCGPNGLTSCDAPAAAEEICNDLDDDCDGGTDEGLKDTECTLDNEYGSCPGITACIDGGSVCTGTPPAAETCDGLDEDCDGAIDEGWPDTDQDGLLDCDDDDDDGDGYPDSEDCGPLDPAVYPGATEYCNDQDDDCDGDKDEADSVGCSDYLKDIDQDQFGDDAAPTSCLCAPDPPSFYTATEPGDCNDMAPTIHPGAPEACNGLDDDCDGLTDEDSDGDLDGDGIPNCSDDDDDNDGWLDSEDCNPLNPAIHPSAPEKCNLVDDDCDNAIDEQDAQGCIDLWPDLDKDEQGDASAPAHCLCGIDPISGYTVANNTDCDDLNPAVLVGGVEVCNGIDDNCDGTVDEGTSIDTDQDGLLDCADDDDDNDGAPDSVDCAPLDASIFPGALEVCDGHDDDCDGLIDEQGAQGCVNHFRDADGDGFGNSVIPASCLCGPDPVSLFTATAGGDCDDTKPEISPGAAEVCNFIDDDCDQEVDDGVASPCGGCQPVCVIDIGEDADDGFDASDEESASGLAETDEGGLTLVSNAFAFPFIWVANTGENTISKLNTDDGCEAARYNICANPSRTAVDLEGNGIVACRHDGHVAKVAVLLPDCIDKNNNGQIDTSQDLNGDCKISGNEMVANDECILWSVKPFGNEDIGRAAGVDKDNNVWFGGWNTKRLARLNGETGALMKQISLSGRPYGLAIDADGIIWVASRDPGGRLMWVHPDQGELGHTTHPSGNAYGIAVDPLGKVWMASGDSQGGTVGRWDPSTQKWQIFGLGSPGYTRGVAVRRVDDNNGNLIGADVFVAHHTWSGGCGGGSHRRVSVVDALTLQEKPSIDLGSDVGPVGVAIDSLGFLWTVNQCSSSASKIDPDSQNVIGTYFVGSGPYTYSDMTGYALKTITTSQGFYSEVFSGWTGAQTLWHQLLVDADLPGNGTTWITIEYRTASTVAGLANEPWQGPIGKFPPDTFPLTLDLVANHLEIKVNMGTEDSNLKPTLHSVTMVAFEQ